MWLAAPAAGLVLRCHSNPEPGGAVLAVGSEPALPKHEIENAAISNLGVCVEEFGVTDPLPQGHRHIVPGPLDGQGGALGLGRVAPKAIVTDRLPSYRAAMVLIGNASSQECGRWLNNRAENSHQPFRRRERAMARFRDAKTLQKFAAVHASIHNHFSQDRHLNRRDTFKRNRSAALAEWRHLAA